MKFSSEQLAEYRDALKRQVCSLCQVTGYENVCRVGAHGRCPIDHHLERIVKAVLLTPRSDSLGDYLPRIRKVVCAQCANQDETGVCQARNEALCGLDSFLLPVVQTIEEVYDRQREAAHPDPR